MPNPVPKASRNLRPRVMSGHRRLARLRFTKASSGDLTEVVEPAVGGRTEADGLSGGKSYRSTDVSKGQAPGLQPGRCARAAVFRAAVDRVEHVVGETPMPPVLCGDGEGVSRGRLWPEGVVPDIAEPLVRHPLGIDGGGRRVRRVTDVRGEFVTEGVVVAVLVVGKHLGSLFARLDVELGLVFGHAEPCREVVLEVLADRLHLM